MTSTAEPAARWFGPLPQALSATLRGVVIAAACIALFQLDEALSDGSTDWSGSWSAWVLSVLLGFTYASTRQGSHALAEERERLIALLPPGTERPALPALAREPLVMTVSALGALIGVLVIPVFRGDAGFLFRADSWHTGVLWSLAVNAALFGTLGWNAARDALADRWVDRELTPRVRVDLLDLGPLRAYAKRGRRTAVFWLIGSSLAALLFVSWPFSAAHASILTVTLATGALSLIRPMRSIHRRIEQEKRAELARTRGELRQLRQALLAAGGDGPDPAARLPALLAWEARMERVPTWPVDASSAVRLALLGALAVGSWVGGALIERILGSWLG